MAICPSGHISPASFADLAFKLLLLGLALVLALLLAFGFFIWLCQRKRRARQRAKVYSVDEQQQKSKPLSEYFAGSPDHFVIGNKNEPLYVLPRQNGTIQSNNNGQQHKLSNGFAAFFQGSPPRTPKGVERLPSFPLAPSPLNPTDYLDLEGGKSGKSVIRVEEEEEEEWRTSTNTGTMPKSTGNGAALISNGKRPNGIVGRKDSIRPVDDIGLEMGSQKEQKITLKNRPFKIVVNDDRQGNGDEEGQGDYKMGQRGESPLMMRRFQSTMEKVPENENERLYGEFESLNQQSMCTLRPRSSSAELPENMRKNRFYDILPFEFNRVKLRWTNSAYGGTDGRSDFVNGSYIHTEDGLLSYIAAQGPIGPEEAFDGRRVNTVRDFWEMVWQEQINCIVMLTQTKEGIKPKCAQYWPDSPGESEQFGPDFSVHLYCVTEDDISFQRELWLHRTGQPERKIFQWHFKEWRDAAGPGDVENLLQFVEAIRASSRRRPILVHCSAGVGRTGVFIALDILLDKLAKEHLIDVKDTVSRLRSQRTNMVQNAEQYVALYEAIALAIRRKSRTSG